MPGLLMTNQRRNSDMERIELFDNYIFENLTPKEKSAFDSRLKTDKEFAEDFKVYLLALKGIQQEAQQDNMELALALKNISKAQLYEIIGRKRQPKILRIPYLRERLAWISSVAAILIIGFLTVFQVQRQGQYQLYDTIVAYNYIPDYDRSEGDINNYSDKEVKDILPQLEKAYQDAPADDVQKCQDAGMRLAMAYLKVHNKDKAVKTLKEMTSRFHNDEDFVARCNKIIEQLK